MCPVIRTHIVQFIICLCLFYLVELTITQEITPAPSEGEIPVQDPKSYYSLPAVLTAVSGLLVGVYFMTLGYRFYFVFLFSVGFILLGGLCFLLLHQYVTIDLKIEIIISAVVATFSGFVTLLVHWIALILAGGFCGVLIASFIASQVEDTFLDWLFVLVLPLLFALFIVFFQRLGVIFATSFGGAYGVMAALDYLAKGKGGLSNFFPRLIDGFKNIEPTWLTWFLVSVGLILTAVGMFIQYRVTAKHFQHQPLVKLDIWKQCANTETDEEMAIASSMAQSRRERRRKIFEEELRK